MQRSKEQGRQSHWEEAHALKIEGKWNKKRISQIQAGSDGNTHKSKRSRQGIQVQLHPSSQQASTLPAWLQRDVKQTSAASQQATRLHTPRPPETSTSEAS
jgi:replication initiation and membrane attachment protein DnaB